MKRILIVDDAIELGRMLQDAIRTVHPEVSTSLVPSAEEALLESRRLTIDLLVTDLRLPGMPGTELIRKIRLRQPDVRVILMTGMVEDERLEKQKQEARPDIFLHKPIPASSFLDAIERLLSPPPQETEEEAVLREVSAMLPDDLVPAKPKQKTAPLKRGTGMLVTPAEPAQTPAEEGLSGILSRLRGSLGAIAVLLVDERGYSVAQAGELPDPEISDQLFGPLIAALSASLKISYLLGQSTVQSVQAYRGAVLDIIAAPVGPYSLLVAARPGRSTTRLALAFEETLEAQAELGLALEAMGLRITTAAEPSMPEAQSAGETADLESAIPEEIMDTPLGQDPALEKFEELFARKKTGVLRLQDPDDFWNQVSTGESGEITQPGVLTFDQAQKLGLVPDEGEPPKP